MKYLRLGRASRLVFYATVAVSFVLTSMTAQAVPSFARQTGMPCAACHTVFPELTSFGRTFKLNGYTLTGIKQIEAPAGNGTGGLKLNEIPPLSAMLVVGATHSNKVSGTQNNDVQLPDQLSFFFAGEVTPHIGSFIQLTYTQADAKFGLDNTDIRYANHTTLGGGKDLIYGLTLNNNPSVQDPWNTAPAWRFPFMGSSTAASPAASALVDGTLAQDVAGVGGYGLWNNHLYGEVTLYRSAHSGQGAPGSASSNTINGVAPYWRLAWQQYFGSNYLEVGTYGMSGSLYPSGISGATDDYTDTAVDAQYEMPFGGDLLALHTTYIHEKQQLNATDAGNSHKLDTFRVNGIYHWGNRASAGLGYFRTSGDSNSLWGTASGKPGSNGLVAEVDYLPWQNTKFGLQYTAYNKFDGSTTNASDNNAVYLYAWLMW